MFLLSGPDYNIIIMKEELNLRILSPRSLYGFLTLREVCVPVHFTYLEHDEVLSFDQV